MIIGFSHNGKNADLTENLTKWFTMQPYTHCELFIEPHNLALSARTDGKGVSLKKASEVLQKNKYWEFFHVPTSSTAALNKWVLDQIGKGYDYADILRLISPISVRLSERWYCSELCYVAARDFGTLALRNIPEQYVHPGRLRTILIEAGAKQIEAYSSLIQS